jgi:hypothetical protein
MTTDEKASDLRRRLRQLGLSTAALNAAWPRWWNDDADNSESARVDLRFSLARNLGLDPRSLFDDQGQPRFVWREQALFKHLTASDTHELQAITSFGKALGALLVGATRPFPGTTDASPAALRTSILGATRPYVGLADLLSLSWSVGIPVAHVRVFPADQKRMAAMTVRIRDRFAILLAKDADYPPQIAFYLGHELGHIFRSHLSGDDDVIVDFDESDPTVGGEDEQEIEADRFALELLTGEPEPRVLGTTHNPSGRSLARAAVGAGPELGIEPGTLALCFGYGTGNWPAAMRSLPYIYDGAKPVWNEVNRVARAELNPDELPRDGLDYLDAVLGASLA